MSDIFGNNQDKIKLMFDPEVGPVIRWVEHSTGIEEVEIYPCGIHLGGKIYQETCFHRLL
jgi:hypothetical protein